MKHPASAAPLRLNVRFDDEDMRHQIEEAAKKACRSMQGEILYRLRKTFQEEGATA